MIGQEWPQQMIDLLLEIKSAVGERKSVAAAFEPEHIGIYEQKYKQLIERGYLETHRPTKRRKRNGGEQNKAKPETR